MGVVLGLSPEAPLPNASQLKVAVTSQRYPAPIPFLSGPFGSPVDFDNALTFVQIYPTPLRASLLPLSMLSPLDTSRSHLRCYTTPSRSRSGHLNRFLFKLKVAVLAWFAAAKRS
jgi:hypothetical protein